MGKISDVVQQQCPMTALFPWFSIFFFKIALDPQETWGSAAGLGQEGTGADGYHSGRAWWVVTPGAVTAVLGLG